MKTFSFNTKKHNFWLIYDAIKLYYPIGIPKDEHSIYFNYPGIKNLTALIVEKIHNSDNYNSYCTGLRLKKKSANNLMQKL